MTQPNPNIFDDLRGLAAALQMSKTTLSRKLKKHGMEKPWDIEEVRVMLEYDPPDSALSRPQAGKKPSKFKPSAPVDGPAPSLEDLEDQIRRTTDKDEAERLSKQIRSLKAMQEVREREGLTIDTERARAEIEAAFTLFQTTLMGWPKTIAATLVGLPPLELETILEGKFTEVLAELRQGLERAIEPQVVSGDGEGIDATDEADAEPMG